MYVSGKEKKKVLKKKVAKKAAKKKTLNKRTTQKKSKKKSKKKISKKKLAKKKLSKNTLKSKPKKTAKKLTKSSPKSLTKKTSKKAKKKTTKKISSSKNVLKGISDMRRFFLRNEEPIYFISATNFNLLGADEWIKSFKFIVYVECFDGLHPNVFSPKEEIPHGEFQSIEEINNYLLEHKEVQDFINARGNKGKALFLMFDEKTEQMAKQMGLEICFPPAKMRQWLDNKVNTNRLAEKAKVPCVPYVLSKVKSFDHLKMISKKLGDELVIQLPFGDSGHTTFFIKSEDDWKVHADEILKEKEVKIMKRINCRGAAIEACVTSQGTVVAPLMTELVGFKDLTPYKGGWCGNEIYADIFTEKIRNQARVYTERFGEQLKNKGYKGYFELDFLIDLDSNNLYLGELNPRITGASSITNHAVFALSDMPLLLFHMLEWMKQPFELNVKALNKRWAKPENIDSWGQMVIKHTKDTIEMVKESPKSGIWKIDQSGEIVYDRMDTHRRAVEQDDEAFFLRIINEGDYLYEGADLGILVMRGRLMTDEFELTDRANSWINAIRSKYKSELYTGADAPEKAEVGGFKFV